MATSSCPIPSVGQALEPYIKPRHEVTRIRNELHGHLNKCIQAEGSPLTAVSLATPHNVLSSQQIPGSVTGVRKAYLKALQAHSAAQARYDALKADLDALSLTPQPPALASSSPGPGAVNETLMPLLRQKEKRRRLEVIEQTYSAVLASGGETVSAHIDDIVRSHAGDLPTPPTQQPPAFGEKPDLARRILQLKKEILSTKRAIDRVSARSAEPEPNGSTSDDAGNDVSGLQEALNVLTGWMETQLATIGDAEAEAQQSATAPPTNGHDDPTKVTIEDISAQYDDYVAARENLVRTVSSPQVPAFEPLSLSIPSSSRPADIQSGHKTAAEILLPYLPTLTSTKQQETTLLNQTSHLRKTLQASEARTQQLLTRLSEESHLVRPGAARGKDWAEAAAQAGEETAAFVQRRVEDGERRAIGAEEMVGRVAGVPGLVENVVKAQRGILN